MGPGDELSQGLALDQLHGEEQLVAGIATDLVDWHYAWVLELRSGLGLDSHIDRYVNLRIGADFVYDLPYRIENHYLARSSGDSWGVEIGANLDVKIR